MARTIISPMEQRRRAAANLARPIDAKDPIEEANAAFEQRRQRIEAHLKAAFKPLTERQRQYIRREVALSVPDKPMTADELQLWLDEKCIGVSRYMTTGKIR